MNLAEMLGALDNPTVLGDPNVEIRDVDYDSREVRSGSLFCCLPGAKADGHRFAPEAVANGAEGLLVDRELDLEPVQVLVDDTRVAMAGLAAAACGNPSAELAVVGVTGTNGKTTVTHIAAQLLNLLGEPAVTIGTLDGVRTTPEAPDLQRLLRRHVDDGRVAVAMEVSSHALVLHRVDSVQFAVGVFTNLSRDHLDFHGSMEDYFAAKRRLFDDGRCAVAVVNVDGEYGQRLADGLGGDTITYSRESLGDPIFDKGGVAFTWRGRHVRLPLLGAFNALNAVAAAEAVVALGRDQAEVAEALGAVEPIPGRFEPVQGDQPFPVVVDYAHTADGLDQALAAASTIVAGRVIVVFGCGGDRDPGKRGPMGASAARGADLAIVTSDNPRSEDPMVIIDAVRSGAESVPPGAQRAELRVEPQRRRAIALALETAEADDIVVIAGKGHETTQVIGTEVVAFDDRAEVRRLLNGAGGR